MNGAIDVVAWRRRDSSVHRVGKTWYGRMADVSWTAANGTAPFFADVPPGTVVVDPIVQSLMLTDVVVEATVMALLLAMVVKAHELAGTIDPDELRVIHG